MSHEQQQQSSTIANNNNNAANDKSIDDSKVNETKKRKREVEDQLMQKQAGVEEVVEAKRLKRQSFSNGNYNLYYTQLRRSLNQGEIDPRIEALRQHFGATEEGANSNSILSGYKALDIGCNIGVFTLQAVEHLKCASIKGIDIDKSLVQKANAVLKELQANKQLFSKNVDKTVFPFNVSFAHEDIAASSAADSEQQQQQQQSKQQQESATVDATVDEKTPNKQQQYNIIFCMSVIKWIHLNQGDAGVMQVFKKIYDLLDDKNGILVLEAQNFKSYKKRKALTPHIASVFPTLKIRPNQFTNILLDKIGFKRSHTLVVKREAQLHKKFNRPITVYYKAAAVTTQNNDKHNKQEWIPLVLKKTIKLLYYNCL